MSIPHWISAACEEGEYQCSNYECVAGSSRCNRMVECADVSDEFDCGKCIAFNQFVLIHYTCICLHLFVSSMG